MITTLRPPVTADGARPYEELLRTSGHALVADVAAIASGSGSGFEVDGAGDDRARLVIALTLLAAGLPIDVVAERGGAVRAGLRVLDEFAGVERYLLLHGLTIDDFHALRERLGDSADLGW